MNPAIETGEILKEIAARLREELDYELEARHTQLYADIFADEPRIRVPEILPELSTKRLLTMTWLEGNKLLDYKPAPLEDRNAIAQAMFRAWWFPFSHYGVIHGDPHLGNYTIFEDGQRPAGINLLDYGCIRSFAPRFVGGVIDLYQGLLTDNRDRRVHAFETWGFRGLSADLIEALTIWARFIYGPLLDDRERAHRRRHDARASTGARRRSACTASCARKGPWRCRASSSSWTARPSASAGSSCTSAPGRTGTGSTTS